MKIFLSYIAEEEPLACAIREALQGSLAGLEVFVSSASIRLGDTWLASLDANLQQARAVLVLCSPRSTSKPWINFESGGGWGRGIQVIPVCHRGMQKRSLPYPLSMFQGVNLGAGKHGAKAFVRDLARALDVTLHEGDDAEALAERLAAANAARPRPGATIGIVRTARQAEWRADDSLFDLLAGELPERLGGDWPLVFVDDPEDLRLDRLSAYAGLIVGNPWRAKLDEDTVDSLVEFVIGGGRLLLLGFELGDRHHDGNLGVLAERFGIGLRTDIVGPATCPEKPYGVPVDFVVGAAGAHPHALIEGLGTLRFTNVQTVRTEPGGSEWLRVGNENAVFRPRRDKVRYAADGTLTAGKLDFERDDDAARLAVAAEAPAGLCGRGAVIAIGTWDLTGNGGEFVALNDNRALLRRLFDWLGA